MTHFTNPFRYSPHPLVRKAAREVMERLDRMIECSLLSDEIAEGFSEGKMLGVLVCQDRYLAAFSGSVGGQSIIEGFVPPIFDLTENGGYYKTHEAEITQLNHLIENIILQEVEPLETRLKDSLESREREVEKLRLEKKKSQSIRDSQFANGEIKRAKDRWKEIISGQETELKRLRERISSLKRLRAHKSDELQRWIFRQYIVYNAEGEKASILDIFNAKGMIPPGGTGDCAAPKLLNYAFKNGLKPIAMGEFWYGKSPDTTVRTHGHFYPSCTSKCGPLLSFMLKGLKSEGTEHTFSDKIRVIYEDDEIIVLDKPSGMPSVPGLDGRESLQEYLERSTPSLQGNLFPVHRLDMDTSGIIIYAKTKDSEAGLKKQFEDHSIRKIYKARLSPADNNRFICNAPSLKPGDKGRIDIALSPDYDERPRQKVDFSQGKESLTEYEVASVNDDGTTDILFYPYTGRTHQLRVHSAHILGLGRPILGDMLYGGCCNVWTESTTFSHLQLHAFSITFRHPSTHNTITLNTL